jgi:hypothetical protein
MGSKEIGGKEWLKCCQEFIQETKKGYKGEIVYTFYKELG